MNRRLLLLCSVFATALVGSDARADGASPAELKECATAYEQTQRLQQSNKLIEALDTADVCSKPACPPALSADCTKWAGEIRPKLPSLVLHVRGGDGCALPQAAVSVDTPTLKGEGDAILVDPGSHTLTVVDPRTNQSRRQDMNLAAGESRDLDVDFAPPGAVCPRPLESTPFGNVPTISVIALSVGAGFILIGGGLGIVGASKRGDLDDCKPHCSDSRINAVRPFFVAGDILGAVGIVGVALGAISYFALQQKPKTTGWHFTPDGVAGSF
jgi:hypothetical protein